MTVEFPIRSAVEVALVALPRTRPIASPTGSGVVQSIHDILITKRLANTVYGGYWELPGGKVEPGEAVEAAAIREAHEELGINVAVVSVLAPIVHDYEHARVRLHTCVCTLLPESPPPRNLHVADHRWCPLDQLPEDEFLPANREVIRAVVRHLAAVHPGAKQ